MSEDLVSVVIPSYNRAHCIAQSVQSVLDQTYANLEVIVVDDGSSDETESVLNDMHDERIRYIWQENAGACVARNTGVDAAKGAFVAFQDSDDIWLPQKLERQMSLLKKTGSDFCICRMRVSWDSDESQAVSVVPSPELHDEDLTFERLMMKNYVSTQMIVGRREIFLEERFDPQMLRSQDWDLALRLLPKFTMAFVDETLVEHIVGSDSITADATRYLSSLYRIRHKHADYLNAHRDISAEMLTKAAMSAQTFAIARQLYLESFKIKHSPVTLMHLVHARFLLP